MKQQKKVNEKIQLILKNRISSDSAYKCLQRLFKNKSDYNLSRDKSSQFTVRTLERRDLSWVILLDKK